MKKIFEIFLLIIFALCLCSCASPQEEPDLSSQEEDDEIVEEKVVSREALYIYQQNQPAVDLQEITLSLNSEPLLLLSGYVRLVGVVSGRNPTALVEVAGKGLCVKVGEEIRGYKATSISEDKIQLTKEGGR